LATRRNANNGEKVKTRFDKADQMSGVLSH